MAHLTPIQNRLFTLTQTHQADIREWFAAHTAKLEQPFYASVDIRHSGMKIAPVDTNLFPAGFNNLSDDGKARAVNAIQQFCSRHFPAARRILIIPENHTRNLNYLDNLFVLQSLFSQAGFETALGRIDLDAAAEETYLSASGWQVVCHGLSRKGSLLQAGAFVPDLIIVNNDFTSGVPEILWGLDQPVRPCPGMGWYRRRKSEHFTAYQMLIRDFGARFDVDPWLINSYFDQCGTVNFNERKGLECVALATEKMLSRIRAKYEEHGITSEPYVYIKADSGTYGMGIMTAHSGEDVYEINKKTRNKMNVIKEGVQNTEVIVQEGVPTLDLIEGSVAEPVIYLLGSEPLGGAWRINEGRDEYINLNAAGMRFLPFDRDADDPKFAALCLISRLASVAAAYEQHHAVGECAEKQSASG